MITLLTWPLTELTSGQASELAVVNDFLFERLPYICAVNESGIAIPNIRGGLWALEVTVTSDSDSVPGPAMEARPRANQL